MDSEASIKIRLPCEKEKFSSEDEAPMFEVEELYYRKPLEVIKSAFEEEAAKEFHTSPYKLFWQPNEDEPPEHIITELYTGSSYSLDFFHQENIEFLFRPYIT